MQRREERMQMVNLLLLPLKKNNVSYNFGLVVFFGKWTWFFFCFDFILGVKNGKENKTMERKIIRWNKTGR